MTYRPQSDGGELRHLRYFIAVAEELSFTKAARRLNIAQPPLSQQIKQLEGLLGVQLFVRSSRAVELTTAGSAFLEGARRTLAEMARAGNAARRAASGQVDELRIGFTDSAALSVLPTILRRFRDEYPGVHLALNEENTDAQLLALENDQADAVLVRGPIRGRAARVEIVLREPLVLALPEDHRLCRHRTVPLSAIAGEAIVLFPRYRAPEFFDVIMGMFRRAKFSPRIEYEAAAYQTITSLVAGAVGVSVVPSSVQNLRRAGVAFRPIEDARDRAEVALAYRDARLSPALRDFIRIARSINSE